MIADFSLRTRRAQYLGLFVLFLMVWLGGACGRVLASQPVELTWSPSPDNDIFSYRVYYWTDGGSFTNSITFSDASSDVTISGLKDGETYYFAVSAINTNGDESLPSNEASYAVPVPDPVEVQVQGVPWVSRSAELTWNPSPDSDVYSYYVSYGTNGGIYTSFTNCTSTTSEGNPPTSVVIPGLASGATYYFAVVAVDAYGVQNVLPIEASYSVPVPLPIVLQTQIFTDENGPYLHINTSAAVSGYWEVDYSPDMQNWSLFDHGHGSGNGDGHDLETDYWMDPTQPQMFFRVTNN